MVGNRGFGGAGMGAGFAGRGRNAGMGMNAGTGMNMNRGPDPQALDNQAEMLLKQVDQLRRQAEVLRQGNTQE